VNVRITILSGVIMHLLPSSEQKSDEERSSGLIQNAGVYTHTQIQHNNNKSHNTKKLAVIFSCPVFEAFNSFYSQEILKPLQDKVL